MRGLDKDSLEPGTLVYKSEDEETFFILPADDPGFLEKIFKRIMADVLGENPEERFEKYLEDESE